MPKKPCICAIICITILLTKQCKKKIVRKNQFLFLCMDTAEKKSKVWRRRDLGKKQGVQSSVASKIYGLFSLTFCYVLSTAETVFDLTCWFCNLVLTRSSGKTQVTPMMPAMPPLMILGRRANSCLEAARTKNDVQ